jgi:hypothetical protein
MNEPIFDVAQLAHVELLTPDYVTASVGQHSVFNPRDAFSRVTRNAARLTAKNGPLYPAKAQNFDAVTVDSS